MTNGLLAYKDFTEKLLCDLSLKDDDPTREALIAGSDLHSDLHLDSLQMLVLITSVEQMGVRLPTDVIIGSTITLEILYDYYRKQQKVPQVRYAMADGSPISTISIPSYIPDLKNDKSSSLEPRISNSRFKLAPVQDQDLPFLYDLATSSAVGFRWRYRGGIPTFENFQKDLAAPVISQFTVWSRQGNERVGHVTCHEIDLANCHGYIATMFSPALIGRGLAVSAVGLFLQNLFQRFNLQKVYMEMIEFNYSQVSSGAERFFHVEGKLHQHEYYDGKFWDKYILAVYRNELLGFQNPEL